MYKGKFITFEGGEGSGKSTQIDVLFHKLKNKGIDVLKTREPGGTNVGENIREILVTGKTNDITPLTELYLNSASRKEHIEKLIKPSLDKGKWVLCDRFTDSTIVYQGYAHGLDLKMIKNLNHLIVGKYEPDLTFIFDIHPEIGLKRAKKINTNENRYEQMDISFHLKIRNSFLEIAKLNKQKYLIIDASLNKERISEDILKTVFNRYLIE
tara:strand:- start:693 stop:1325 length:633 start_codon:yes stop_codon:yes gene_type:complete